MCSSSARGFPEAGPYVAKGLASLITDVVGDSVAGAVDARSDHRSDQIVSGRGCVLRGSRRVAMKLCGIEIVD